MPISMMIANPFRSSRRLQLAPDTTSADRLSDNAADRRSGQRASLSSGSPSRRPQRAGTALTAPTPAPRGHVAMHFGLLVALHRARIQGRATSSQPMVHEQRPMKARHPVAHRMRRHPRKALDADLEIADAKVAAFGRIEHRREFALG